MKDELKRVGKPREFSTGSRRDSGEGKPRYSLLPWDVLDDVVRRYEQGADAYGVDNWRLGQPNRDVFDSAMRHLKAFANGEEDEDHLSAVIWNCLTLKHNMKYYKDKPEINNYPIKMEDYYDNSEE